MRLFVRRLVLNFIYRNFILFSIVAYKISAILLHYLRNKISLIIDLFFNSQVDNMRIYV